ncbi:MAG: hypothetical protein ACI8TA_001856 [Cyclobacteriaceae bacterium]
MFTEYSPLKYHSLDENQIVYPNKLKYDQSLIYK